MESRASRASGMAVTTIHQTLLVRSPPMRVYRALLGAEAHRRFTKAPARFDGRVGGKFSYWGGFIQGVFVDLDPDRGIVMAWRTKNWRRGQFSLVRIEIKRSGRGARLVLDQQGVPARQAGALGMGWREYYWKPLKAYLEG